MARTPQERQHGGVGFKPADFQMRLREILARAAADAAPTPSTPERIGPYLAISRQAGAGGTTIARLVGRRLGWKVLDRELVDDLANRLELSPDLLSLIDETRTNWFSDTLLNLMNSRLVLQDSYVAMLGKVMAVAAYEGRVVFVGRGAHLVLPRPAGLCVRIVGSLGDRVRRLAAIEEIDERTAGRRVDEIEENRVNFMRRQFHFDPDDASGYDLVLDSSTFGDEGTAEVILGALEVRGLTD